MKNTNFKPFGSKAAKVFFTVAILSLVGITSCKKDAATKSTSTDVTEADAVELTTDAVTPSTGGYAAQVSTSASIYANVTLSCGVTKDTTITRASASGITTTYGASLNWQYVLNCNGAIPTAFVFSFTGNSTYSGPKMSSNDASTGGFTLSGIQPSASDYTLNSTYERKGTAISKIGNQNTFNSDLKIVSTNILIDKVSQQIVSGTGTVTIAATSSSGKTFNFNGTITFLGGKKATLVLNSGTSYAIQWS